jgi:hypothetical protein
LGVNIVKRSAMFINMRKLAEIDGCSAALEKLQTGTCSKTKCMVTVVLMIICELSVHIHSATIAPVFCKLSYCPITLQTALEL